MGEQNDSEITLGVGRLLMLFFGLVLLCGIFLGLGYTMGRNSMKIESSLTTPEGVTPPTAIAGTAKPGAVQKPTDSAADLTFYKSVEKKDADAQLTPSAEQRDAEAADHKPVTPNTSAPEMKSASGNGIMVQVAAVSKREDAEALTDALRRKQYPVVIINAPADKLFHVQLGPFADVKEAEAMKGRLVNDGYNPIVKK